MTKYALFVKEKSGKWYRVTKKGKAYASKQEAIKRKKMVLSQSEKPIGVRKVRGD